MSDFNSQVQVDLRGNMASEAKRMERAVSGMTTSASRSFSKLGRTAVNLSNGIDRLGNRYTGLATGMATGALVKGVVSFNDALLDIKTQAGMGADEVAELKQRLYDVANDESIRINPQELIRGLSAFIDLTGDMNYAQENLRNIGLAMRATGADSLAIAQTMDAFRDIGISGTEDVRNAFELLVEQGKRGSVPFRQMASEIGPLALQMKTLGYDGQEALNFIGAFFMTARKGTGSAAEAATATGAFLEQLADKSSILREQGVKFLDEEGNRRSLELILKDTFKAFEKIKDPLERDKKVFEIFGQTGSKAIAKLRSEFAETGELTSLNNLMGFKVTGDQIEQDAIDKAHGMGPLSTH